MKKVKVRFGIRTDKSLKQSFSIDVMRQFYLHSSIACLLISFALLFISEENYRIRDEVGYVIASVWWLACIVLFVFSVSRNRQKKKTRSIAMPVDIDGNVIKDKTITNSPRRHAQVLSRNKLKFVVILLIQLSFYYSIMIMQFHEHEESEIFIYGFPLMILIITFISAIVVVPGLKTNIKIIIDLSYLIDVCLLTPVAYYVYEEYRNWNIVFLTFSVALVLALAFTNMYKNLIHRKETEKLLDIESIDE